jgi:hypothetical protein
MDLKQYQQQKELIRASEVIGEVIEGENMTDIIGYAPLNMTIEDMISAGYVASMNLLSRIIHDIETEEQLKVFENYVVPFYRRTGIDFLDAYNEVRQKISNINKKIVQTNENLKAVKTKKFDVDKQSDEKKIDDVKDDVDKK